MSIPYLVHKEDADAYDAINAAMKESWEEMDRQQKEIPPGEGYMEAYMKLRDSFDPILDAKSKLLEEKYGRPRIIAGLQPKPCDLENYYTYYRGYRWGEAAGCEMMQIAEDGFSKCMHALEGKK